MSNYTDTGGNSLVAASYDAYGDRRGTNWQGDPSQAELDTINALTRRGFTEHEMLDSSALIHMNGRAYNPIVGRFVSADPYFDCGLGTQGWNRYAYVGNRALSGTDPTGFETYDAGYTPENDITVWDSRDRCDEVARKYGYASLDYEICAGDFDYVNYAGGLDDGGGSTGAVDESPLESIEVTARRPPQLNVQSLAAYFDIDTSAFVGLQISAFVGAFGGSRTWGVRLTSDGQGCLEVTTCGRLGLGLIWFGVEVVAGGGVSFQDGGGAGNGLSVGIGGDIGWGEAVGIGANVATDGNGFSGGTGRAGGGVGIWGGVELCYTETVACTREYSPD